MQFTVQPLSKLYFVVIFFGSDGIFFDEGNAKTTSSAERRVLNFCTLRVRMDRVLVFQVKKRSRRFGLTDCVNSRVTVIVTSFMPPLILRS